MDHLRQLSARYNAVWMETGQLYETWARRRGLSFYELLVVLSITETEEAVFQKDICRRFTIPKQTVHKDLFPKALHVPKVPINRILRIRLLSYHNKQVLSAPENQ